MPLFAWFAGRLIRAVTGLINAAGCCCCPCCCVDGVGTFEVVVDIAGYGTRTCEIDCSSGESGPTPGTTVFYCGSLAIDGDVDAGITYNQDCQVVAIDFGFAYNNGFGLEFFRTGDIPVGYDCVDGVAVYTAPGATFFGPFSTLTTDASLSVECTNE
jgi:hypothetical protein